MNKLAEFQAMLADAGIDPAELVGSAPATSTSAVKVKRAPRPPKYRYVKNGQERTSSVLTKTPMARLRKAQCWEDYAQALIERLSASTAPA